MIHALDLHERHPEPLTATDLLAFRDATPHISQLQSLHRRSLMRRARSTKKRPRLLAELESRTETRPGSPAGRCFLSHSTEPWFSNPVSHAVAGSWRL